MTRSIFDSLDDKYKLIVFHLLSYLRVVLQRCSQGTSRKLNALITNIVPTRAPFGAKIGQAVPIHLYAKKFMTCHAVVWSPEPMVRLVKSIVWRKW